MQNNSWLILIPTREEARFVEDDKPFHSKIQICGFGPVAAAASTSRLISMHRPSHVMLLGIAGTYSPDLEIGQAYQFEEVGCDGIGVGSGGDFRSASSVGWMHYQGADFNIGDRLNLTTCNDHSNSIRKRLLTVCSASGSSDDARRRGQIHDAEDMEGFAVASAAKMAGVPCFIVRGISNVAGNRDHKSWQIEKAMTSASQLAQLIMGTES